jgi:hypothetical protein
MLIQIAKRAATAAMLAAAFAVVGLAPAQAQAPSVTKQCGEKWAAAKTAGTTGDLTWLKFLSQCRAELAAQPAPTTTAASPPATADQSASAPTAPAGAAVFPTSVSTKYSSEMPGKARMQTCLDQYNANKATDANGGMKWIEKGGGYYSECNKRLKG